MSSEEIERTKQFIVDKSAETAANLERASADLDRTLAEIERLKRRRNRPARKDVRLGRALAEIEQLKRRMAAP